MSTAKQPSPYTAYLLRCWLEGSSWRYSLEEVGTGKCYNFATLDEFVSFMLARSMQPDQTDQIEEPDVNVNPPEARR